jgi:hypothetical protein
MSKRIKMNKRGGGNNLFQKDKLYETGLKNLSSTGIMETVNHFKNGVNLQNLSSRNKI